jgi:hypothetical protein
MRRARPACHVAGSEAVGTHFGRTDFHRSAQSPDRMIIGGLAVADDGAGQAHEGFVGAFADPLAGTQAAEPVQQRDSLLHNPEMNTEAGACSVPRRARCGVMPLGSDLVAAVGVGVVGVRLVGASAGSAALAARRQQFVEALSDSCLVPVRRGGASRSGQSRRRIRELRTAAGNSGSIRSP